jgi:5-methylcytosine-specific restriction enzyme subunit McrC
MTKLNTIKLTDNFCKYENGKYSNVYTIEELSKKNPPIKIPKDFSDIVFPNKGKDDAATIHCISLKESNSQKTLEDLLKSEVLNITKRNGQNGEEDKFYIKTGNYLGVIYDANNKLKVEITSRFGDKFLQHMLNYINDIYIPNLSFGADKEKKKQQHNQFQLILAHLFIQSLEKSASIFGLPKQYNTQHQQSFKVRGKLDIQKLINHNIPLRAKLHSSYREQTEVQEIIDVLHKALSILDKKFKNIINARVLGVKQTLKEKKSSKFVNNEVIQKAKKHKVLIHPSYQSFKKVLKYAEMIIKQYDFTENENSKMETKAYLFDASELFEIYLEKVLQNQLDGWSVSSQKEIKTYGGTFFAREMRPDLVLENTSTKQTLVFDVKYKKMNYDYYDVDRNDFFQIHTYMAHYFDETKNTTLVAGGLLYPIEREEPKTKKTSATKWLGNSGEFVIDGINLKGLGDKNFYNETDGIEIREKEFVKGIQDIINPENKVTNELQN